MRLSRQYGEILDTRWPAKKFKNSRRFLYLQYQLPVSVAIASAASKLGLTMYSARTLPWLRWSCMGANCNPACLSRY